MTTTAIIGGGIVGLNIAWSLRHRGEDVIVLDAGRIGAGASGINAGWVTPSFSTPLASPGIVKTGLQHMFHKSGALVLRPRPDLAWMRWLWSFSRAARPAVYERGVTALRHLNEHTLDLFDKLAEDGVEFEMHDTGILALSLETGGLGWFTQLCEELAPLGVNGGVDQLTPAEARELDPAVGQDVRDAVWARLDRFVDPESLLTGLVARLTEMGVPVHQHRPVQSLTRTGSAWSIHTDDGAVAADNVVLALGTAANSVLRSVNVTLPIMGAKGYSVELAGTGELPRRAFYLTEAKLALSPLHRGVRLAGVFELPADDHDASERRIRQLVERARPYLGGWRPDAGRIAPGRAGLRPMTPDSLPFIGPVPRQDGLFVAVGHGMLGVTLAPATAEAMTTMVVERVVPDHLLPFQLSGRI